MGLDPKTENPNQAAGTKPTNPAETSGYFLGSHDIENRERVDIQDTDRAQRLGHRCSTTRKMSYDEGCQ